MSTLGLALIILLVIFILAYYGFMKSVETGAGIANAEVQHLADVHEVSLIARTAAMGDKLDDNTIAKASEVKTKLAAMRAK